MEIKYEWVIDFPLILTIIGVIGSYFYTSYSIRKNVLFEEWKILSEIYEDSIYLLGYGYNKQKKDYVYTNTDKLVEKLVCYKLKEFDSEVDTYWSFHNRSYKELEGLSQNKKTEILQIVDKEYSKAFNERYKIDNLINSPAFYSDNEDVLTKITKIKNILLKNSKYICKYLREQSKVLYDVDPIEVRKKYLTQIEYSPEYFQYNKPLFTDPYRKILITIRRRYEWLEQTAFEKIKTILWLIFKVDRLYLFKKHKWLRTGPL